MRQFSIHLHCQESGGLGLRITAVLRKVCVCVPFGPQVHVVNQHMTCELGIGGTGACWTVAGTPWRVHCGNVKVPSAEVLGGLGHVPRGDTPFRGPLDGTTGPLRHPK